MKTILLNTLLLTGSLLGTAPLYAQVTPIQQVGIGTSTPKAFFNVVENRDVLFGLDVNGGGNKLIWYGSKGAFRAGSIAGIGWNTSEVGQGSFASGINTQASGIGTTALGNSSNASGRNATAIGFNSTASGGTSTAMGYISIASGETSTAMGFNSTASGETSTAIGNRASADGNFSTALGNVTRATGESAIAIGNIAEATGQNSIALGYNVSTNGQAGSVIIGDRSLNRYVSDGPQKMTMRFGGGYVLYSAGGPQNLGQNTIPPGVELRPGGNSWFLISDSTKKENYRHVDGVAFLKKISQMRLGSWNYRGQDPKVFRHYGPMAQDFFAAFGHDELGVIGEPTGINQGDFDGVNLIAIKALITEVDQLKADNQQLRQQLREVQQLRADLDSARQQEQTTQARLTKIEALLSTPAGTGTASPKPQTDR